MKYVYETIVIFDPTKSETKEVFRDMCQEFTGTHKRIKVEDMGVKKLAYPLKDGKFTEGYYVVFTWMGTPDNVTELERCLRINDNVLKFITVKKDPDEYDYPEDQLEDIVAGEAAKSEQSSTQQDAWNLIFMGGEL